MKLYQGDCLEIMKQIPDKSVDCVITDPPYFYSEKDNGGGGMLKTRKYTQEIITKLGGKNSLDKGIDIKQTLELLKSKFKVGFNGVFFCNQNQLFDYLFFAKDNNYRFNVSLWHKTNPTPLCNNKYLDDVEFIINIKSCHYKIYGEYKNKSRVYTSQVNKKDKVLYEHPTIKPLELVEKYIVLHTKEKDIVLDPFMGSGTTGVACKHLNRNFIGIELDEKYFNIAKNRIEGELL